MIDSRPLGASALRGIALLVVLLFAARADAYKSYDDGTGKGCVSCHNGFQGGTGPLHLRHRTDFGITNCNVCHQNGGGSTPVLTYWSGSGGGFGCAGCHGQDYGETSPNSGVAKATSYGLRQFHVNKGITTCGTSGCHKPGALGHSNPFPPLFGENEVPPYFAPLYSNLTNPCWSSEESLGVDGDSVGLDNDGDGAADFPADLDCLIAPPTTTTTTTTTLPAGCAPTPAVGCTAPAKGVLLVNEKTAGKEKLKIALSKFPEAIETDQYGDPVGSDTSYDICIYDSADELKGRFRVARGGDTCAGERCWVTSSAGYKYADAITSADGIAKMMLTAGGPGKGKIVITAKNNSSSLPLGIASALTASSHATVQVVTSDADCFGLELSVVKKAEDSVFSATGP